MTLTGIHAQGVTKRVRAADDVPREPFDLRVGCGEMVAVTGPSSSGKTTLVNLLAGWQRPDAGTIVWDGARATPPDWSELTVVPQSLALIDELDVIENITLASRNGFPVDADELATVIDTLGLATLRKRSVEEISIGERQRVMVARALVGRPGAILADEPVAHQDQRNADAILGLLARHARSGALCLVATRERDVAAVADRVVTLP